MDSYKQLWASHFSVEPSDHKASQPLFVSLGELHDQDPNMMREMYADFLNRFETMMEPKPSKTWTNFLFGKKEELEANNYLFVRAFSKAPYNMGHHARKSAEGCLHENHDAIAALLTRAITHPDRKIIGNDYRARSGSWGNTVMDVVGIYYWHVTYGAAGKSLQEKIAPLVGQAVMAFPQAAESTSLSILEQHPDAVNCFADILRETLSKPEMTSEDYSTFGLKFFSTHASREDFWFKNGPSVLPIALSKLQSLPVNLADQVVKGFILKPLGVNIKTQQGVEEYLQNVIGIAQKNLTQPFQAMMGISAERLKEDTEQRLGKHKQELARVQSDFASWEAEKYLNAVKGIAKSATVRRSIKAALPFVPAPNQTVLHQLLEDADALKNKPKLFPKPKRGQNQFKDFGLKLLVIEDLMFRQAKLTPKFDLKTFISECDTREISIEDDGYDPIPEVEAYFRALETPAELLNQIEELSQSSGIHSATGVLFSITPYFDGGTGQRPEPVTDKAIIDLDLLPNLRRIVGLENSNPSAKLLKALNDRHITLVSEEDGEAGRA